MLVDLDYFFAQAEELKNPSLTDKPVVVCVYSGRSEDSGAVSTANYLARKFGVKSGMPIFLAKRKLENAGAVFLPVDSEYYESVSGNVMTTLRDYADRFEQVGIDEAYLDVTAKTCGNFADAKVLALKVKNHLKTEQRLSCSIGIGPNKIVAKIAADIQKPDGLTIVEPNQVGKFLSPLPVARLPGVGAKTKERMQTLGISTIGDLAKSDVQKLMAVFGKTLGTFFHNASLGVDEEPVQEKEEVESISRIATLKQDTRDLNIILELMYRLCKDVYSAIAQDELFFKTVSIVGIMKDLKIHTRSRTLGDPMSDYEILRGTVRDLVERFLDETDQELRRVGVKVSNLTKEEKGQKQLTSFVERE